MITDEQFDELAQEAHFFGAMAAVFGSVAVFGYGAMWYGIGGILLFAAVKEFWYDRIHETPEVRGSGIEDFGFYFFGAFIAAVAVFIRHF